MTLTLSDISLTAAKEPNKQQQHQHYQQQQNNCSVEPKVTFSSFNKFVNSSWCCWCGYAYSSFVCVGHSWIPIVVGLTHCTILL